MSNIIRILVGLLALIMLFGLIAIYFRGSSIEPNPCSELLVVTRGETIDSIAARCGVDSSTIYDLNPGLLEDGVTVNAGMMLRLAQDANLEDAADAIIPATGTP